MTTVAAQVPIIRRLLDDRPLRAKLTAAIADATTETFSVSATDALKFVVGETWEHDDSTGERREVTVIDLDTPLITGTRGEWGSTAAAHSNSTYLVKDPRFPYDTVSQAINQCLDYDLYPKIYEIVEHQVTSNLPTNGHSYNSPATACEKWLDVYQRPFANDVPKRVGITYTVYPQNTDTALWSNGKVFEIYGGKADGTEKFYVNCAHRLTIGTLLTRQERLVQYCAAKYLLEWLTPRRTAGPTNQSDRSVRPTDPLVTARYFGDEFTRLRRREERELHKQVPSHRIWVPSSGTVTYGSTS